VTPKAAWRDRALAAAAALLLAVFGNAQVAAEENSGSGSYEQRLMHALAAVNSERFEEALVDMESLVRDKPDFRLAQLVYADLLMARQGPIYDVGGISGAADGRVEELREELRARWGYNASPAVSGNLPLNLLELPADASHAVVVDLGESRLFLFENRDGMPYLVDDFYVSIGKQGFGKVSEGDKRTPVGAYLITDFLPADKLPDFYGYGAFPLDYPNAWDRRQSRTGSGIWLHGTPLDTYSRAPRASDGCVTLANSDLEAIAARLKPGRTPVVLADEVQWLDRERWQRLRSEFRERLVQWQRDWESVDTGRYLRHYSRNFSAGGKDFEGWSVHKRRVNGTKTFIDVDIIQSSIFFYPGESDLIMVQFEQDYRSSNFNSRGHKRQFWKLENDGVWRIVYEGPT